MKKKNIFSFHIFFIFFSYFSYIWKEKNVFFLVRRTFKAYSLSNLQLYIPCHNVGCSHHVVPYLPCPYTLYNCKFVSFDLLLGWRWWKCFYSCFHSFPLPVAFFITSPLPPRLDPFFFSYQRSRSSWFLRLCFNFISSPQTSIPSLQSHDKLILLVFYLFLSSLFLLLFEFVLCRIDSQATNFCFFSIFWDIFFLCATASSGLRYFCFFSEDPLSAAGRAPAGRGSSAVRPVNSTLHLGSFVPWDVLNDQRIYNS